MTQSLKVAVIGAGPMGRHHAIAINTLAPLARVSAIADSDGPRAEAVATEVGGKAYTDIAAMLRDKPDVVHICTSPASHFPLAKTCLEAGAHVYVEKPFTESSADARALFELAASRNLRITAGHQLLYERPTLLAKEHLARIGTVQHVESYFAFRQANRPGGRTPYTPAEQLLDILPHPVYLLIHFLGEATLGAPLDLSGLRVDGRGNVHAIVGAGSASGVLVATLTGRPVDSYVKIVGTRGSLTLDYVRGIVLASIGAGSTIEKIIDPYSRATTSVWGTTTSLARRVLKKQRSYPGLAEAFGAFYRHVQGGPAPFPTEAIARTVQICEIVDEKLKAMERAAPVAEPAAPPTVAVTGGTGMLGRRTVRALVRRGITPLVIARRVPSAANREPGAHYIAGDYGAGPVALPPTITTVIHAAAETAGSWDAHQRNSIDATKHVLDAMKACGAKRLVHVSSLAVIDADARTPLSEASPLEHEPRRRGAYVWGKAESERMALAAPRTHGVEVKVVRPGALVDAANFDPPGKLGKLIGSTFIAFDNPAATIPISDLDSVADILAWEAADFAAAPAMLNAVDPEPASRRELIRRVKADRPGTRVIWVVRPLLRFLSGVLFVVQKVLRPGKTAINLTSVFTAPECDTALSRRALASAQAAPLPRAQAPA